MTLCRAKGLYMYSPLRVKDTLHRPTQSMIYVHFLVNRFEKSILLIVQYKYSKSCAEDQMFQDLILRTRLCGTSFITHPGWLTYFHATKMVGRIFFVPVQYQRKGEGLM